LDEGAKKITAEDVKKIDRVDMKKVHKKFPAYARKEDLSHGRGQGKRVGKTVMGGMATVGLSVTIRDYGKQFGLNGEDLAEIKSMASDSNQGQMLLIHYAKARYAGYPHGQAAAYAYMKADRESPDDIAAAMNRNESEDEATTSGSIPDISGGSVMGGNRTMNTGPGSKGIECPICGKKCKKGVCPTHGKVYEAVLAKDIRAKGKLYKKGLKVKPLLKTTGGMYNIMLAPGITTVVKKDDLVLELEVPPAYRSKFDTKAAKKKRAERKRKEGK